MSDLRLCIEPDAPQADRRQVIEGLISYNASFAAITRAPPIALFLRGDQGTIRGGLLGEIYWNWLHVSALWVHEEHRGRRHGSRLLSTAEREAVALGCHSAHLDTFGFQARPFYEKHGYRVFGELPDCPLGYTRYYLYKRLGASTPA